MKIQQVHYMQSVRFTSHSKAEKTDENSQTKTESIIQQGETKPPNSVNPFLSVTRINIHTIPKMTAEQWWATITPGKIAAVGNMTHEDWWASLSDEVKLQLDSVNGVIGNGESLLNLDGTGRLWMERNAPISKAQHEAATKAYAEYSALGEKMIPKLEAVSAAISFTDGPSYPFDIVHFKCPNGENNGKILVRFKGGGELWVEVPPDFDQRDFNYLMNNTIANMLNNLDLINNPVSDERLYEIFEELFEREFKRGDSSNSVEEFPQ
ncbi:MAG: hypothetical protein LBI27_03485 [Clostridiales bacterium]|jgi:hypothetical protein|nr:hypothetical protein [Clostridiales bacterium]